MPPSVRVGGADCERFSFISVGCGRMEFDLRDRGRLPCFRVGRGGRSTSTRRWRLPPEDGRAATGVSSAQKRAAIFPPVETLQVPLPPPPIPDSPAFSVKRQSMIVPRSPSSLATALLVWL